MEALLLSPVLWIVVAALSEIIALSPLRDNSMIQLAMRAIKSMKPGK